MRQNTRPTRNSNRVGGGGGRIQTGSPKFAAGRYSSNESCGGGVRIWLSLAQKKDKDGAAKTPHALYSLAKARP